MATTGIRKALARLSESTGVKLTLATKPGAGAAFVVLAQQDGSLLLKHNHRDGYAVVIPPRGPGQAHREVSPVLESKKELAAWLAGANTALYLLTRQETASASGSDRAISPNL